MKRSISTLFIILIVVTALTGCTKKQSFPEETPDLAVIHFYKLLADGSKISNREALNMLSDKYIGIDPNDFRDWTDSFNTRTTIEVVETIMPIEKTEDGLWIASVLLNIEVPSSFGDTYTSTSRINCIFSKEDDAWKIDFMGDTIQEDEYLDAPADAKVPEEKES